MNTGVTGTPPMVRLFNRRLILERIRREGEVSRADLAKLTDIRPPTVSAVIKQMIDEDLVEEVGDGKTLTGTGRKPRMVALSRKRPRALGFEVNAASIRAGLCHLDGTVSLWAKSNHSPKDPESTVQSLFEIGDRLLGEAKLAWSDLEGVGVALPGLVDSRQGIVRWSRPFDWHMVNLRDICQKRWKTSTDVANNAVSGSMAEHTFGVGREMRSLVYVYLRFDVFERGEEQSEGVVRLGSGIIINSKPYHGEFGAAGEITSLVQHPRMLALNDQGMPYADTASFEEAVVVKEPNAVAAMERVGWDIASRLMDAVNFLDPAMVVIDSDHAVLGSVVLSKLQEMVETDGLRRVVGTTKVVGSRLGEMGMVVGAVTPTLDRLFGTPHLG